MRGDRGGENTKVSIWMIVHRGPGRASFMWGSSTRNTRIERLWVEVGSQFARRWRAFFTRLGRLHRLDRKNSIHLWLLHQLFLQAINDDCLEFQEEWNLPPISGAPPTTRALQSSSHRRRGETGAGHTSDDEGDPDDSDEESELDPQEELENQIQADQAQNIRHAPVKVARHHSPFDEEADEQGFLELLAEVLSQPDVPEDYGILPEEWEGDSYDEVETIRTGTNGKELVVALPETTGFLARSSGPRLSISSLEW
ncbi:hypothetical protein FB451DRAFT_1556366 [Mycena latifolia]|nr:hypothetical protein FB451DRAFT_1556366 [Mycena latifolia]